LSSLLDNDWYLPLLFQYVLSFFISLSYRANSYFFGDTLVK
jgi:hypothetical protein